SLVTSATNAWTGLINWLQAAPGAIGRWFIGLGNSIATWAVDAWHNLVSSAQKAGTDVLNWLTGLPGEIGKAFVNAGHWLLSAGGDIIHGLWSGITGAWNAFWSWVGSLWDSFIQGFKDAMGIHSPSSVFMQF